MTRRRVRPEIESDIQDAITEGRIGFASTTHIEAYRDELDEMLWKVFGVRNAFICDGSRFSDFCNDPDWTRMIPKYFDIPEPAANALILDVVVAIRKRRMN